MTIPGQFGCGGRGRAVECCPTSRARGAVGAGRRRLDEAAGTEGGGQLGRAAARELSLPPLAQTVSGLFFDGKLKERQAELEARCNALYTQARSVLGQVSVYKPSIKIGGNSAELVRQLAKANDG